MKKYLFTIIACITLSIFNATAQQAKRTSQFNVSKQGLAIEGYDPVSYFLSDKPVRGKKEITCVFEGISYRFASEESKKKFISEPAKYEPQYGGWCAYAMGAKGEKVEVDPETFKIVNGKLYLFYNSYFNNTLKSWNKNELQLKNNADVNWMKIYH